MEKNKFIELYLKSNKETKEQIKEILSHVQIKKDEKGGKTDAR